MRCFGRTIIDRPGFPRCILTSWSNPRDASAVCGYRLYHRGKSKEDKMVRSSASYSQLSKYSQAESLIQDEEENIMEKISSDVLDSGVCDKKEENQGEEEIRESGEEHPLDVASRDTKSQKLLKEKHPDLFLELIRAKNVGVGIENLEVTSARIFNWMCSDCHKTYRKSVVERVYLSNKCPRCMEAQFKPFEREYPDIAKEWSPKKNPLYSHPRNLDITSLRKVTWNCSKCDFEYEASVKQRSLGAQCPRCVPKHGNWATRFPEVAKEWHPLRNGDLRFTDVNENENRLIWWICRDCSYEYEEGIKHRLHKEKRCPLCQQDFRENVNT